MKSSVHQLFVVHSVIKKSHLANRMLFAVLRVKWRRMEIEDVAGLPYLPDQMNTASRVSVFCSIFSISI